MAGADMAAILVEVPVEDVVTAIFDGPMSAIDGQEALRGGFVRGGGW